MIVHDLDLAAFRPKTNSVTVHDLDRHAYDLEIEWMCSSFRAGDES